MRYASDFIQKPERTHRNGRLICSTVAVAVVALALGACVTRSKHAATIDTWEEKLGQCKVENDKLQSDMRAQLDAKDQTIAGARDELSATKEGAAARQAELDANLKASQAEIAALRAQRAKIEANLAQYRKLEEAFKRMIGAGEIRIYRRRGRIMVALPSSVLFPSGKASLSRGGTKALAEVAKVLTKVAKRRFLVAGHTDNVPIRTSSFADNWSLSVERATVVTRYLVENGMPPASLAAAGYGEYDPLVKNSSPNNRRRNRRIEIILMPNIDELPQLPK